MNTDKNGWPYLVVVFLIAASLGGLVASTDNQPALWLGGIFFFWFWSCIGLFLNLAFSEQLSKVPLYKKLMFSFFPLMYLSVPWRKWFLKELNPEGEDRVPSNT